MKNPFQKILDMKEQASETPEQETQENNTPASEVIENQNESEAASEDAIAELQRQVEESRNKYLYLFSDFENFKRNAARERMDLIATAGRDIMSALLPILDDFDRAAKNAALSEGTALIHHKLAHTLRNKGLVSLDVKVGDEFDPDQHEAVAEIPAPDDATKGKVVDILEQGYTLGSKIIRHAKVVVGK
ncbi:MAG: nucleotide exchange factor GrpE [Saprospiraceae bacterium]|nr:nucleotide exchange factor GrpE [Saprospiraceae bacterium]